MGIPIKEITFWPPPWPSQTAHKIALECQEIKLSL